MITFLIAIVGSVIQQNFWNIYDLSPWIKLIHGFSWAITVILAITIPFKNASTLNEFNVIKEKINGKMNRENYVLIFLGH